MKKNLFEEENINDLENVTLEDLLKEKEEEALASKFDKTKEVLKQATTKTLDVSKKVATQATKISKELGYKALEKAQDEQFQRNIAYYASKFLNKIAQLVVAPVGMLAYIFYTILVTKSNERKQDGESFIGIHLLFLIVPLILIWLTLFKSIQVIIFLLTVIWIEYYLMLVMYGNNWSKKYSKKLGILNPFTIYFQNPIFTATLDNDLETKLFGDSRSKNEQGSLHTKKILESEQGHIRLINILKSNDLSIEVSELSDDYITKYGILPMAIEEKVFYIKDGWAYQSVDYVLGKMTQHELIQMIKENDEINFGFPEIAEKLALQKEEKLNAKTKEKIVKIINKLKKNQDEWGISIRNMFGKSLKFSPDFLKVRADLMGNTTRQDVAKNTNKIAQKIGIKPIISVAENESAIYLLFKLKNRITSRELSFNEIVEDANKGIINVGAGILGDVKMKYPRGDDPFFVLIGGISRSGKSAFATRFITGALYLQDGKENYDYEDVFIGSMKARDDYKPLKWAERGMVVLDKPMEIYSMLLKIDEIARARVDIFEEAGAKNIKDYNEKNPDKPLGKILLIMDEYRNTLNMAANYKVKSEGGSKKLSEAIEQLFQTINSLHGSRGVNAIAITQEFQKGKAGVGIVRSTLGDHFLGWAEASIWNAIDDTRTMSNYIKDKKDTRQGLFFSNAPNFRLTEDSEVDIIGETGYTEISTHFTETEEIAKNFDRTFQTAEKYLDSIIQGDNDNIDTSTSYTSNWDDDDI
ncbi:hypothetical protein K5E_11250 [Enterococcus thailandicus]|uniref:hypothetical protein n=1 Tax=Enterococcus thailandicus TaxID=417368 RepID=UPI00244D8351|nr:hypothetical protein [Enterococcus thailandicus]GMC08986.1 hypothetical protein K5E_11250 [Enterococcus thailandicus]